MDKTAISSYYQVYGLLTIYLFKFSWIPYMGSVYSGEGVRFSEDNWRRGVKETRSPTPTIFCVVAFVYPPKTWPLLWEPMEMFVHRQTYWILLVDQAQMMHITVMSTKLVSRCLTNHHIVRKYAVHFVLDPYKKQDSISLLINYSIFVDFVFLISFL